MDTSTCNFALDGGEIYEATSSEKNIDVDVDVDELEDNLYYPQVAKERTPRVKQEFSSLDHAYDFYNAYAKECGFSVRKWSERKNSSKEIIRKEYVCSKEGKSSIIESIDTSRRRGSTKEDCKAKLAVGKLSSGNFEVKVFSEAHSHPLATPSRTKYLNSHREVSAAHRSLSQELSLVNIPKHQQYDLFSVQSGGIDNVGFIQKDLYNHGRDLRKEMDGHDGKMLYEYLKLEQGKNSSFIFEIEKDDENKITRVFWADATMRRDYSLFGDVVIFDTTYNTNRYGLILAPFVGVNNHGQTVVFACAFLSNETIESFMWLFKMFLKAMPGGAPKMIITDQDASMINSVPQVFPSTFHRYCSWHILTKFSDKINSVKYKASYNDFSDCIWNSRSREEFESTWEEIVRKHGLKDNTWLESIFDIRSKWVPVFMNDVFSAGMTSSQRAESNHSFFKDFVGIKNSLADFMIRFARGLEKQRQKVLLADHIDLSEKPKMKSFNTVLLQMANVYTRDIFYKFQDELLEGFNYKFQLMRKDDDCCIYKTERKKHENDRGRELVHDSVRDFVSCSCKNFESSGIPCRHILGYLQKFTDFEELPDAYIFKRWTKSVRSGTILDDAGMEIVDDKSFFLERNRLMQCFLSVVDTALTSGEKKQILIDALKCAKEKIDSLGERNSKGKEIYEQVGQETAGAKSSNADETCKMDGLDTDDDEPVYGEPNQVSFKGCGKRLKKNKEKALAKKTKQIRTCGSCGQSGTGHNKTTCPHKDKFKDITLDTGVHANDP